MGELAGFSRPDLPAEIPMWCASCGTERTVSSATADPGACPTCGCTVRTNYRPSPERWGGGGGVADPAGVELDLTPAARIARAERIVREQRSPWATVRRRLLPAETVAYELDRLQRAVMGEL